MIAGFVRGQEYESADQLYGEGVRAYFSGDAMRAEGSLSQALEIPSQDPRPYYFRALSLLRLGRAAEARGDMLVGAALEAQQPNRYGVGKSLERVQGYDRLLLERFRRQARVDARARGPSNGLMQASGVDDSRALRQRVVIPLDAYLQPGIPQHATSVDASAPIHRTFAPAPALQAPSAAAAADDPFRDDPHLPAANPAIAPPTPTAAASPVPESTKPRSNGSGKLSLPEADGSQPVSAPREPDAEEPPIDDEDPFAGL
jgi:hypothetical protein